MLPSNANVKVASGDFDIETSDNINAVQDDWEWLEAEGLLTPFQTRAWLLPFYGVLAPRLNATPVFVLVRDRLSRRPVMLLPLCALRRYGITIIEFADLGVSDYNAPIIAKTFDPPPSKWRELWHNIVATFETGSILRLEKMPHLIGDLPNPLAQYNKESALMDIASWGVMLPPTRDEYNKSVLHPSFAKELAKKARRIAKRGEVEYVVAQTRDEKRIAFDILARQRQARCDEMGRPNILAQPVYRQFYESVAVESPGDVVSLTLLKVGGEIVGTVLALNHQKAFCVIMSTYQGGAWKSCSLGNIVIQSTVEHSIDNGVGFFDFTIGNEGYKQHFGALPNALFSALQPLTLSGFSVALTMNCCAHIKRTVKRSALSVERKFENGFRVKLNGDKKSILSDLAAIRPTIASEELGYDHGVNSGSK
jgi:CelD/BcsL family acetyltransferase involved in cellulose biosynthesis